MRTPGPRQHGFTLVEMMIALCILGIAVAAIVPAFGMFRTIGDRSVAESSAEGQGRAALALLRHDLGHSIGARSSGSREDTDSVISALDSLDPAQHDLLLVGPRVLEFWSDVLPATGPGGFKPERVRWFLATDSTLCDAKAPRNWCVVRDVMTGGAGGAPSGMQREVMTHGVGAFPVSNSDQCSPAGTSSVPRLFCYSYAAPLPGPGSAVSYQFATWTPACEDSWKDPGYGSTPWNSSGGTPFTQMEGSSALYSGFTITDGRIDVNHENFSTQQISSIDRITRVGVVLPSSARSEGAVADSTHLEILDMRARTNAEYDQAILCGGR